MLSLHTNSAALAAQNAITRTQATLSTSQTRLSTGYRVNSAMDDAAGLQIATRLNYQTSGMTVAMRNTQNSISMMQTAEGALDETSNILTRMKDLATQSADGSATDDDRIAMQSEYDALGKELTNIVTNTAFGGTKLLSFAAGSKFATAVTFQIGTSASETMTIDLNADSAGGATGGPLDKLVTTAGGGLLAAVSKYFVGDGVTSGIAAGDGTEVATLGSANTMITTLSDAIDGVSTVRSALGAASNRLDHVYNNLANVSTNTKAAAGRIVDTDFAAESSSMTSAQMLLQAGTAMLKQSNSTSSLVMSLLQ